MKTLKLMLVIMMVWGSITCNAEYYNAYGTPGYYQQQQTEIQQNQLYEMQRQQQLMQMQQMGSQQIPNVGAQVKGAFDGLTDAVKRQQEIRE